MSGLGNSKKGEYPIFKYQNHSDSIFTPQISEEHPNTDPNPNPNLSSEDIVVDHYNSIFIPGKTKRGLKYLFVFLNIAFLVTVLTCVLIHFYNNSGSSTSEENSPLRSVPDLNTNANATAKEFELKLEQLRREFEMRINSMSQEISTEIRQKVDKMNESFIEEKNLEWRVKTCGDASWTPISLGLNEKCVKLLDDKMNFVKAVESCRSENASQSSFVLNIDSWTHDQDSDFVLVHELSAIGLNFSGEVWIVNRDTPPIVVDSEEGDEQVEVEAEDYHHHQYHHHYESQGQGQGQGQNQVSQVTRNCQELPDSNHGTNVVNPADCSKQNWVICQKPTLSQLATLRLQNSLHLVELAHQTLQQNLTTLQQNYKDSQAENEEKLKAVELKYEESVQTLSDLKRNLSSSISQNFTTLQQNFEEGQAENEEKIKGVERKYQESVQTVSELQRSLSASISRNLQLAVPIGFIYTQFYNQPAPTSIWPGFSWTEVTSNYAGQFFRALGGASASFGQVQQGNSPRITQVQKYDDPDTGIVNQANITPGSLSLPVRAGFHSSSSNDKAALQFLSSAGEVRPLNSAIKIWKRTS